MLYKLTSTYSEVSSRTAASFRFLTTRVTFLSNSIPVFYRLNDLLWQDGLIIDFLQKKVADK